MSFPRSIALALALVASGAAWAAGTGVEGEIEQSTTTTPQEKQAYADKAMSEINSAVSTVQGLVDQAKKEKNDDALKCLQPKLVALKALQDLGGQSNASMQAAIAASDAVHADAEFRKLAVAVNKSREFLADAQQCTGAPGTAKTTTKATSTVADLIDSSDVDVIPDVSPVVSPN